MEITPSSSTPRTTKVRVAKPAAPKASAPTKKSVTTKPIATKAAAAKPKVAAAPRKRKPELAATLEVPASLDLTPMIAIAAYYLAEQRHFVPGQELADWLTAEHTIRSSMPGS